MCVYIDINMYTGDISACHVCLPASSPGQRRGRICGGCPRRKMGPGWPAGVTNRVTLVSSTVGWIQYIYIQYIYILYILYIYSIYIRYIFVGTTWDHWPYLGINEQQKGYNQQPAEHIIVNNSRHMLNQYVGMGQHWFLKLPQQQDGPFEIYGQ